MMEAARTSETSIDNYFIRQYIPQVNSELHTRRRENLKSHGKRDVGRPMNHHSFSHFTLVPSLEQRAPLGGFCDHTHTIRHTVEHLWTSDQHVAETSTYTGQHNTHTPMLPAGFEPSLPATKRPQTYALDCAATGIGRPMNRWD
jgi:hypothetical protein